MRAPFLHSIIVIIIVFFFVGNCDIVLDKGGPHVTEDKEAELQKTVKAGKKFI